MRISEMLKKVLLINEHVFILYLYIIANDILETMPIKIRRQKLHPCL